MKDRYNREINYLRISVTDRCNLRCLYCVPKDGTNHVSENEMLSFDEIVKVCNQAAKLGISGVKITGGEPLIREGIPELVRMIHNVEGIEHVTLTTNGTLLDRYMDELVKNGLDAVNISIDSLNPERYCELTRGGNLEDALRGLEASVNSGITVKTNTVLYPGNDWKDMIYLAKDKPVYVRFIETMPIGMGDKYPGAFKEDILKFIGDHGLELHEENAIHGNGPAVYYKPEGYKGYIGIIAPLHGKFCGSCNRIRMSATGMIKPCLCYKEIYDMRKCIREGMDEDIEKLLIEAILSKPEAHSFSDKELITETRMMSEIGG